MGNDIYFAKSDVLDAYADDDSFSELWSQSWVMGLFWIACFRVDDIRIVRRRRDSDYAFPHLVCEIEKALNQFDAGINVLRDEFPETNFDRWNSHLKTGPMDYFRSVLSNLERKFLILDFDEMECRGFSILLRHGLLGFEFPEIDLSINARLRRELSTTPHMGVRSPPFNELSWGATLRRLCIRNEYASEEFFDAAGKNLFTSDGNENLHFESVLGVW